MKAGKMLFTIVTKTICCAEAGISVLASDEPSGSRKVRPRIATAIAAPSARTTQTHAIHADFFTALASLMPMKRTMMCGIPK